VPRLTAYPRFSRFCRRASTAILREQGKNRGSLLGNSTTAITLLGTSYAAPAYGFPDALRYILQRDILAKSVPNTLGSWVGMESYLRDDSFQTNRPKLLIWEIPNARWIRRRTTHTGRRAINPTTPNGCCVPRLGTKQLHAVAGCGKSGCRRLVATATDNVTAGKTTKQDFIELSFDKPFGKLDYLVASIAPTALKIWCSKRPAKAWRHAGSMCPFGRWRRACPEGALPSGGKGFTKLLIYPGKSSAFVFKGYRFAGSRRICSSKNCCGGRCCVARCSKSSCTSSTFRYLRSCALHPSLIANFWKHRYNGAWNSPHIHC